MEENQKRAPAEDRVGDHGLSVVTSISQRGKSDEDRKEGTGFGS